MVLWITSWLTPWKINGSVRVVARTATYPLIDRLLGGTLEARLREQREGGASFADISRNLFTEHDLTVSIDTVRRWCMDLGIEKPEPEAASA